MARFGVRLPHPEAEGTSVLHGVEARIKRRQNLTARRVLQD